MKYGVHVVSLRLFSLFTVHVLEDSSRGVRFRTLPRLGCILQAFNTFDERDHRPVYCEFEYVQCNIVDFDRIIWHNDKIMQCVLKGTGREDYVKAVYERIEQIEGLEHDLVLEHPDIAWEK